MTLSSREIKEIVSLLETSGWDEAQIEIGDVKLWLSKGAGGDGLIPDQAPPQPKVTSVPTSAPIVTQPEPAHTSPGADIGSEGGVVVTSPSVGIFWRSPEPAAASFVDVGAKVEALSTLCIVEIMKLMISVPAGIEGIVSAIYCTNGEYVERGTPLFTVLPVSN